MSTVTASYGIRVKAPPTAEEQAKVARCMDGYQAAVNCVGAFIEMRAHMSDAPPTDELFEEFKKNVCARMRAGWDSLGEQ